MDLDKKTNDLNVTVKQDDSYSRNLELALYANNEPWTIPEGISVLIHFSKSDGRGGMYDTMPDGTPAWWTEENKLTIALAPQTLTAAGLVLVSLTLYKNQFQIGTQPVTVCVAPVQDAGLEDSESYSNVTNFLPKPETAQAGQYLRIASVDSAGHITRIDAVDPEGNFDFGSQTLTEAQQSQIRQNIGLEDLLVKTTEVITGINLNDGVYEIGRFSVAGEEYDKEGAYAFRNANYLPVEGGRSIVAYYAAADWNLNTLGYLIDVVQYDSGKNVIGATRHAITNYANSTGSNAILALHEHTAYIRIDYNRSGTTVFDDLTKPKIAVYYLEDAVQEFVEYTVENEKTIIWIDKSRISNFDSLRGKKIAYDGDSIAETRTNNGGGYAQIIADLTGSTFANLSASGAYLCSGIENRHCVADNLSNLPANADLYCFEGGINDYWGNVPVGTCTPGDYTGAVDAGTVCGALETIFRYALTNFPGKPVCFVIPHKIQNTADTLNAAGKTFRDYRDAMLTVCEKYSIPCYDAFACSGLNGWNEVQSSHFLTGTVSGNADGCHPNAEGYRRYYVPQLLALFRRLLPAV